MQYKEYLVGLVKQKHSVEVKSGASSEKKVNVGIFFIMPPNAPKSTIVVKKTHPKQKARLLYSKYIESDYAPLEINISSQTRTEITEFISSLQFENAAYTNKDILQLLRVFDGAIREISDVLDSCFTRYNQQFAFI